MLVNPIVAAFHPDEVARDFVSWLSGWLGRTSPIDWVLLAASLGILYFLAKSLEALTRVGSVEVDLLDSDAASKPEVRTLTAALRERLASSGLPAPPVVPAGSPQARVVAAVAASPIPQASFIAKALELMPIPEPLQYKLSGTLCEPRKKPAVRFWLRPSARGRPLMKQVDEPAGAGGSAAYENAIRLTAFEVYSFISTEAVQAFPTWARWNSVEALEQYEEGCAAVASGDLRKALTLLSEAEENEPANALVRLQLANVYEQLATANSSATERAREQAEAMRRYLDIAYNWPWLVQARYRASVLAALAAASGKDSAPAQGTRAGLGLSAGETPESVARRSARSESDAVLQLLKPWYTLFRWRRLRYQFEPSAEERRQLKRVLGISRQCRRVRSLGRPETRWGRCKAWLQLRYCEGAVRVWHLALGLIRVDWQTHYVAACFYALLWERMKPPVEGNHG